MESKAFVCMSPVQICLQSQAEQVWILKMGVRLRVALHPAVWVVKEPIVHSQPALT